MKLSHAQIKHSSQSHLMGTATLVHKRGADDVFFVAPNNNPEKAFEPSDAEAPGTRYYNTNLVAETAFKDLQDGRELVDALTGRDLPSITEHCIRNTRDK